MEGDDVFFVKKIKMCFDLIDNNNARKTFSHTHQAARQQLHSLQLYSRRPTERGVAGGVGNRERENEMGGHDRQPNVRSGVAGACVRHSYFVFPFFFSHSFATILVIMHLGGRRQRASLGGRSIFLFTTSITARNPTTRCLPHPIRLLPAHVSPPPSCISTTNRGEERLRGSRAGCHRVLRRERARIHQPSRPRRPRDAGACRAGVARTVGGTAAAASE